MLMIIINIVIIIIIIIIINHSRILISGPKLNMLSVVLGAMGCGKKSFKLRVIVKSSWGLCTDLLEFVLQSMKKPKKRS